MARTCVNFTAEQVLAALRGETVVYREAVKPQPKKRTNLVRFDDGDAFFCDGNHPKHHHCEEYEYSLACPYGSIGNTLWVRETWYYDSFSGHRAYKASIPNWEAPRWKSAVTMPRWASRLSVRVTAVSVEQVAGGWEWVVEMGKA